MSDAGVGRRASVGSAASGSSSRERDWRSEKDALEQTIGILRPVERALLARPPEPPAGGLSASASLSSCYFGSHLSINSLSSASASGSSAGSLSASSLRKLSASHHSSVEYVLHYTLLCESTCLVYSPLHCILYVPVRSMLLLHSVPLLPEQSERVKQHAEEKLRSVQTLVEADWKTHSTSRCNEFLFEGCVRLRKPSARSKHSERYAFLFDKVHLT